MNVENYSRKNPCCSCCLSDVHSASTAAELHPIVEVQSGYFFGAISDGKWMKADETANLLSDESAYLPLTSGLASFLEMELAIRKNAY
jgi:hypothetical protein